MSHSKMRREEEERRGGYYTIDYIVHAGEKKSSSHDKTGLVLSSKYLDFLFAKSFSISEIYSLFSFWQNFRLRFQKFVATKISERIDNLQFDVTLIDLIKLEEKINGF